MKKFQTTLVIFFLISSDSEMNQGIIPTFSGITSSVATTTSMPTTMVSSPVAEPTVSYLRLDWFFNPSPNNPDKLWYHFAGSKAGLKRYAEVFIGSVPNTDEELDQICLYEIWLPLVSENAANWTQLGFGRKLERKCHTEAGSSVVNNCRLTLAYNEVKSERLNKTLEHVTLTDNETFAVYVQTWEDGLRDWNVVVPLHVRVSKENMALILKHVRDDLGFLDEDDIYHLNYASCSFQCSAS